MKREIFFRDFKGMYWPKPEELSHYFLTRAGTNSWGATGNDDWGIHITGLMGTGHLPIYALVGGRGIGSRIEAHLGMVGDPQYGVLLDYRKFGNGITGTYCFSIRDPRRLHEWVRTRHSDLMPVGLYIPFAEAWPAVKEFMETDGELPKSIPWIASIDLPSNTFPEPRREIRAIND